MGFEVAIGSLVIGVLSQAESIRQSRRAAAARREQREISSAEERVQLIQQRRRENRERRVRAAQIRQQAENTGVAGSSGESIALANLSTNVAISQASTRRQVSTVEGITGAAQREANASVRGQIAQGVGQIAGTIFDASLSNPNTLRRFNSIFD